MVAICHVGESRVRTAYRYGIYALFIMSKKQQKKDLIKDMQALSHMQSPSKGMPTS